MSDTPTTRRFPRTLTEAFPYDARHAYAVERPHPVSMFERVFTYLAIIAVGALLGWAVAQMI